MKHHYFLNTISEHNDTLMRGSGNDHSWKNTKPTAEWNGAWIFKTLAKLVQMYIS